MLKADVLAYYGSKVKVAKVLGITRQAIQSWGDTVPFKHAVKLEELTGGHLLVWTGSKRRGPRRLGALPGSGV